MVLMTAEILGKIDAEVASGPDLDYLRFITPLVKLFTAKEAVGVVSEGVECFGGLGYMENSNIPIILRDA
jgi:alkylation response protein AidB-like acyl-CoA dehydrogenase